ncbi:MULTISPECIES: hypothetical protein [Streptomyces]|uniref:hypothetical protein n=1 Tax=Streptomyces TaxID=1883 RepID=UPI0026CB9A8F
MLARHGITFQQSVTLRLAALADGRVGPVGRDQLDDGVSGALKTDAAEVHGVLDELIAAQLPAAVPSGQRNIRPTGSVVGLKGGTE